MKNELWGINITDEQVLAFRELTHYGEWAMFVEWLKGIPPELAKTSQLDPENVKANCVRLGRCEQITRFIDLKDLTTQKADAIKVAKK